MNFTRRRLLLGGAAVAAGIASAGLLAACVSPETARDATAGAFEVELAADEWRRRLTPEQYEVLREAGTERPYSSPLNDEHGRGVFGCAGCMLDLYASDTKFDSGTGWPSFWQALPNAVREVADAALGMTRIEVLCRRCGGHLGHVFPDGPKPTGLRYCMNGVALVFRST